MIALLLAFGSIAFAQERFEFSEPRMGTVFRIALYAENEKKAKQGADAAFAEIEKWNRILSDYDRSSELMRLHEKSDAQVAAGFKQKTSPELFEAIQTSIEFWKKTAGAFDVTLGPLNRLWRNARAERKLPGKEKLEALRKLSGPDLILVDLPTRTVAFKVNGMQLDFGGIGKGIAVDAAATVLRKNGIDRFLIAGSGDVLAGDPPPGKTGWKVGLAAQGRQFAKSLELTNRAVSTSGDVEQFLEYEGKRYSHILDPKTGYGLTHGRVISVVAPDSTTADALATAVSVATPEGARVWLKKFSGVEVHVGQKVWK